MSEDYYALCGACGTITEYADWTAWSYDDEDDLVEAPEGDPGAFTRCPACRADLSDDDSGPALWAGTLSEMVTERTQIVADYGDYPETWADRWHDLAAGGGDAQ